MVTLVAPVNYTLFCKCCSHPQRYAYRNLFINIFRSANGLNFNFISPGPQFATMTPTHSDSHCKKTKKHANGLVLY